MNIGIVGLGLMGGSIAAALKDKHNIYAYDLSAESLQYALDNGVIHQAYFSLEPLLDNSAVIFLCIYPLDIAAFIRDHQDKMKPGTVIIEISGIKTPLVNEITPLLRKDLDMIFTHPIAGREKIGVYYSLRQIFQNQNFVIVPTKRNKKENLQLAETLAMEMGFKHITNLSPEGHDEAIAYTSQLAHVLALAVMNSDPGKYDTAKLIGDSFRDLTRIAMINDALWNELFVANKEHLVPQIDRMIDNLQKYREAIASEDKDTITAMMHSAKIKRLEMEKGVSE